MNIRKLQLLSVIRNLAIAGAIFSVVSCGSDSDNIGVTEVSMSNFFIGGGVCVEEFVQNIGPDIEVTDQTDVIELIEPDRDIDCTELPDTELGEEFDFSISDGTGIIRVGSVDHDLSGMVTSQIDPQPSSEHYSQSFLLHDGEYRSKLSSDEVGTARLDWGIYNASIALAIELHVSRGETIEDLDGPNFEYSIAEDIDDPNLLGSDVSLTGLLIIDDNADGLITSEDRFLEATVGQVSWSGNQPMVNIEADLGFADSEAVRVSFTGSYDIAELPK